MTPIYSQYSPPAAEPISLVEAKIQLQMAVDIATAEQDTTEDGTLPSLITAARMAAEEETWRPIVLQGFDMYLEAWPIGDCIDIPKAMLRKVDFLRYTDVDGELREFTEYTVDKDSVYGRIVMNDNVSWPEEELRPNNPIHIRFWAGELVPCTADADTNTITAKNHPFIDGDVVRVSVTGGGLPGGLVIRTDYFIVNSTESSLQLSETIGGQPINLTSSSSSGTLFLGERPEEIIRGMILLIRDLRYGTADFGKASSYWFSMAALKRI